VSFTYVYIYVISAAVAAMCCSVLQYVAGHCEEATMSRLYVCMFADVFTAAVRYSALQCAAVCCSVLQGTAKWPR